MVRIRTLGLAAARIAAVAFALVTLFVFVVQAQRKAERKRVAAQPVAADLVAPSNAPALDGGAGGSTVAAPVESAVRLEDLPTFLPTSKSLQLSPTELVPNSTAEGDLYKSFGTDATSPVFLPSSKVRIVSDGVRDILRPGSTLHEDVKPSPKP